MIITDLDGQKSQSNSSDTVANKDAKKPNTENPTCLEETLHPVSNLQENQLSSVTNKASSTMSSSGTS